MLGWLDSPTQEQKAACGEQCLANGERCSQYFSGRLQNRQMEFERAMQNYQICLRKFAGTRSPGDTPCIGPQPQGDEFDNCGQQLDECLDACDVTLDDIADAVRRRNEQAQPKFIGGS